MKRILALLMLLGCMEPARAQDRPNIVFILLDNVGWGDFGVYGGMTPTPRVDKMASEGIRFNNYNVEAQCTPTRSAIVTGRMPVRSGTFRVPYPGEGASGLSPWEYTLPKLLSDAGYATALFGKWHLGETPGRLPSDQGFDEWWGVKNSWDEAGYTSYPLFKESGMETPMIWEGKKGQPSTPVMPLDLNVRPIVDEKYIIPKTVDFIKAQAAAKKTFFVYVAYSEMHPPSIANPGFDRKSVERGGLYSDLLGEMDYRIGQILDAIKEAGVDDSTIVILTSDDATGGVAASPGGSNGPWRGDFFNTPFEGSMRTVGIVRWPGKVPAGVVTQEILAAVDWLPTLAGIVGASDRVPKDRPVDGVDASAFLLGKSNTTMRDSYMFFGPDGELMSVKWKIYKVVFRYSEGVDKPIVQPQFPLFYDLSSDPHEDFNLFSTRLDNGWMLAPAFRKIIEYQTSVKKFPNIKPGEEFTGYPKN
ncbi:MAG TPA: arylsulfatase [Roseiarcus sp.]|nr:arylsulfatase [Roseiarcus sp.]